MTHGYLCHVVKVTCKGIQVYVLMNVIHVYSHRHHVEEIMRSKHAMKCKFSQWMAWTWCKNDLDGMNAFKHANVRTIDIGSTYSSHPKIIDVLNYECDLNNG